VNRSYERWAAKLGELCGYTNDHLVFSNNCVYRDAMPKKSLLPESSKCLPFPGFSSFALLALCLRWCTLKPQAGGLLNHDNRKAAEAMLGALIEIPIATASDFTFTVEIASDFVNPWPRPHITKRSLVVRLGLKAGIVQFADLRRIALQSNICKAWCKVIDGQFGTDVVEADLMVFLQVLVTDKATRSILGQLLATLAMLLEKAVGSLSKGTGTEIKHPVSKKCVLKLAYVDCDGLKGKDADILCARYIMSCQEYLSHRRVFYIATDGAQVCRLPLQNSCVGASGNFACLAPPNVPDNDKHCGCVSIGPSLPCLSLPL
jgi:hypothetical protein